MGKALAQIAEVERMLAGIETVGDAATVRRAATAVRELARQAGLSLEEQNRAAEAKIRAEWQGGRLLARMERGEPGRPEKGPNAGTISPYRTALHDAGLSTQEASRWQRLADFDADRLAELIAGCEEELTTAYVLRAWRREEKNPKPPPEVNARAFGALEEVIASGRKYGTVYADPPC